MNNPLKGQIGIFVVISVILVAIMIFIITFSMDNVTIWDSEKSSHEIKQYVESCLLTETEKAINLVGIHGGWLYHPPKVFTDRKKPEIFNKGAQGLNFLEKTEMPYWYYYDDSQEKFIINIPEYDNRQNQYSIINQIKTYVDENLERNCIQSFNAFNDIYEIDYEPRQINTNIEFIGDKVVSKLNIDLRIKEINSENEESISKFEIETENKIKIPYLIARDIVYAESNTSFIEERILDFISPYQSANGRDLLPPFYEYKLGYDFEPWDLRETETLFKQIVSSNIGLIQFMNTNARENQIPVELRNSPFVQGVSKMYERDYISSYSLTQNEDPRLFNQFSNYKVRPYYEPFFPIHFSIAPSMGDVILLPRPEAFFNLIPMFLTEYIAVYEVTLPVIFEIRSSIPNDDFIFNLPIETNIDHNSPLKKNKKLNINISELTNQINTGKSLICDPPQFISDFVYLNISDPIAYGKRELDDPQTGVEDAIVSFDCKGISKCYIGQTSINGKFIQNNITQLKFRLPINCNPGTLEIYKYGHQKLTFKNLDPTPDKPINLGHKYMPSEKELKVKLKFLSPQSSKLSASVRSINSDDNGFIIFENKDQEDATKIIEISEETEDNLTIKLLPGNYTIKGFVIHEDSTTIPGGRTCYDTGFFIFSDEECFDLPEINLDAWVRSGIEIDNFEVTLKMLANRDVINVNLVEFGIPKTYETLEKSSEDMTNLKIYSEGKPPYFTEK